MLDRAEQRGIGAAEPREHPRVRLVALGRARGDGAQLAGVGHEHRVAQPLQEPADPRAVRAGLHHEGRGRIALAEGRQALAGVRDRFLGEDLPAGRQDAHRVAAVPEI